jgi:hypothetical protein
MKAVRFGAVTLVTTIILGVGAGTAWAPRVKLLPVSGTPCTVDLDKGTFVGSFGLQSFTVQNGTAMAVGSLTGTCSTDEADVAVPAGTIVSVAFKVSSASCDEIHLDLADAAVALGTTSKMAVAGTSVTLVADPKQVRGQMCAFAQKLPKKPLTDLVPELNKIFARMS